MIKKLIALVAVLMLMTVSVSADKVYEYELSESVGEKAEDELSHFINSLPEEIKNELPESRDAQSVREYDFAFFAKIALNALKKAIVPSAGMLSGLLGLVIASCSFHMLSKAFGGGSFEGVFSFCSTVCTSFAVFNSISTAFTTVDRLLSLISDTMIAVLPVMEAIHIASGNLTAAVVSSTGISLMIGFTQSLFAKIISPSVYILFVLCVVSAVTKNRGLEFMAKTLKGIITGAVIAVMALMTFVLALQTVAGSAADTLAAKTVKFAIGTYLPIVGGSISETFSMLSAGVKVLKSVSSVTCVAALLIAFIGPCANLLLSRVAVALSGSVSEVLGCEREGALLSECKGIFDLLLAVCISSVVMFIVALGIFAITNGAV